MTDTNSNVFQFDDIRVEPRTFKLLKAGREVSLEPKTFRLLLYLIENRGRLIEKSEILDAVWKDAFVTENAMTREIAKLRKSLGDDPKEARYIQTVPTRGYRFVADVLIGNGNGAEEIKSRPTAAEGDQTGLGSPALTPSAPHIKNAEGVDTGWKRPQLLSAKTIAVTSILIILFVASILVWRNQRKPAATETDQVKKVTQITSWLGLDIYPTLSPDGSSIAYSSDHSGNFEIYVRPLAPGGREIQITSDGQQNLQPAWSPDGQHIAYYSKNRGGIWVVAALGGVALRLTEFGSEPAWSPDSSMIAFQTDALTNYGLGAAAMPPSTIWVVPSRGGEAKQITRVGVPSGGHGDPSWSPDGRRIMFIAHDANMAEVWSISARGDELKQLTSREILPEPRYSGPYNEPIYAPDGKSVYFAGVQGGVNFGLWKIPISPLNGEALGEPALVFSSGFTPIVHLNISADGKRVAYSAQTQTSNLWSIPISPGTSEATGPPVPLMQDTTRRKSNPAFSPDGQKIAVAVWRAGMPVNVWLVDADGKNGRQLTIDQSGSNQPNWMRSNDEIAYTTYRQGRRLIMSLNLKSGIEQPLYEFEEDVSFTRLSPDATQVAYNSRKSGTINLWINTLDGSHPRQLTFDEELAGFPCWSPDGQFLAFELKRKDSTHIAIIQGSGGEPTQLTFEQGQSFPHSWSPDGEKIAFAGFRNGFWNVWWVSRKDKTEKQVTNHAKLNSYVRYPAWSPQGNQIVYEYSETTGNIWLMELK